MPGYTTDTALCVCLCLPGGGCGGGDAGAVGATQVAREESGVARSFGHWLTRSQRDLTDILQDEQECQLQLYVHVPLYYEIRLFTIATTPGVVQS